MEFILETILHQFCFKKLIETSLMLVITNLAIIVGK